jgi:hypothetical protein
MTEVSFIGFVQATLEVTEAVGGEEPAIPLTARKKRWYHDRGRRDVRGERSTPEGQGDRHGAMTKGGGKKGGQNPPPHLEMQQRHTREAA